MIFWLFVLAILTLLVGVAVSCGGSLWSLVEILIGIALGYYVISKTFRQRVKSYSTPDVTYPIRPKIVKRVSRGSEEFPELKTKPIEAGNKNGILINEDDVREWLEDNPDLRKANEGENNGG